MSDKTTVKELKKNRAYRITMGGVEIVALNLEGFKATQLGGTLSPWEVAAGGEQASAIKCSWLD